MRLTQGIKFGKMATKLLGNKEEKEAELRAWKMEPGAQREMKQRILQLLNEPGSLKETINKVLGELKLLTGFDAIGLRMQEGNDYPYYEQIGFSREFVRRESSLLHHDPTGRVCRGKDGKPHLACTCGLVISGKADPADPLVTGNGSWWVNDSATLLDQAPGQDTRYQPRNHCIYLGYSSVALVPIRHQDTIIGLIQFNDYRKGLFTQPLVEYLEEIATHIAATILRKQAEEKLARNEELLRSIAENAPDMILQLDRSGTIVYINRPIHGMPEEECIGKKFWEWTLPEYHAVLRESLNLVFESACTRQYLSREEVQGERRWIQSNLSPVKAQGTVRNAILISRDVTSMVNAQELLKEKDKRHRVILQTAMDGLLVIDGEGQILEVNETYARMSGYSTQELGRMQIFDLERPMDGIGMASRLLDIMVDGESRFESRHQHKNGNLYHVETAIQYQDYQGGQFVIFIHDITERKLAEEKLRHSENRYKSMFQNNYSVMLLIDPQSGEIRDANPAACQYYGWPHGEICGKNISEINILTPEEIARNLKNAHTEKKNHFFFSHRLASGEIRQVEVYSGPIRVQELTLLYTIIHDITEKKLAEEALQMSERRLDAVFNAVTETIMTMDTEGNILMGNRTAADRWGVPLEELKGKNAFALSPPYIREQRTRQIREMINTGLPVQFEDTRNETNYHLTFYPLKEKSGDIQQFVVFNRDVTEQKKAEQALRESEQKFRNLVRGMQTGVLLFNSRSEVILGNPKALELLGINEDRLKQIPFFHPDMQVIHEDGNLFSLEELPVARVLSTGKAVKDCVLGIFNYLVRDRKWILVQAEPQKGQDGNVEQVLCTFIDISELKKKDDTLKKLNYTLKALSKSSQALVHSTDETDYLGQVCNIVMDDCGYAMVWIGFAREDEAKGITPVACAGFEDGYLDSIRLSWGENEFGRGPTGKAIRTGEACLCTNMLTDPGFTPWREDAIKRGYNSSIAIPLLNNGKAFGAITIYSRELDPFTTQEVKLLSDLANDLAYGITSIRLREAHQEAQEALAKSYEKLEELVKIRTRVLEITNEQLNAEIENSIKQEQHLIKAEEKYRTVADFTYNMETWIDTDGNYIYVSPSSKSVTGYAAEEFMNDPNLFSKIAYPEDIELVEQHFIEKNKGGISNCTLDFRIITPEGEVRWLGHSCQKVYDARGEWIGQRGSNRDITKQKKAEQLMIESKNHLRALTHRMDIVAEEERIRISREIHDELGHLLTALKYDVEGLINHSALTVKFVKSELKDLISMIDSLIDSVRKIATDLRPGILDHLGVFPAIEWKIKQFRMKNKICCEYTIEEMDLEFNKDETFIIFRILQEIFTNVSRHSMAKYLWINIYRQEGLFCMKVKDDGIGFENNESLRGSLGLLGMRERAMSIGGEIEIESAPGQGTTVTFSLKK